MIATILPESENFHAVGYNERKVSKGTAQLLEMRNFGAVGVIQPATPDEKVRYLQRYSSRNDRVRKAQFHVAISCKCPNGVLIQHSLHLRHFLILP